MAKRNVLTWSRAQARAAGRRDARSGKSPQGGLMAWPGTYMEGYRAANSRGRAR